MSVWTILAIIVAAIFVINLIRAIFTKVPEEPQVSFQDLKAKKEARERSTKYRSAVSDKPKPSFPCVKEMEVKGTIYRSDEEKLAACGVEVGDTLILEVEPDNPVDPNAVKVLTLEGMHIGYVQWDIAQFVKDNISHVNSCTVTKVTRHDIPFIHASIHFSASECKQPSITPEELRVSAEDKMRDLILGNKKDYKYRNVLLSVDGTFEQSLEVINKAKSLRQGDKVILKKPEEVSEFYHFRLNVYTEDGTMIGFCFGSFAQEAYELFDDIYAVTVDSPMNAYSHQQINLRAFIPQSIKWNPSVEPFCERAYKTPYPQLVAADSIKRTDPDGALELALPIAECEKGINGKFLCCQIFRLQKNYEAEREMLLRILERIESITPDEIGKLDFTQMKSRTNEFLKRLDVVESRLKSKSRKKSNDTLA